ncbi:MAG: hypothetical protein JW814_02160 [Candidatus Krumholzibacteriota bacterium]|nr:hypothetical protein [Candidatus Krumholzibacteriota bacterium]
MHDKKRSLSRFAVEYFAGAVLILFYFLIVTPFALLGRLIGTDLLMLKRFKAGKDSVMTGKKMRIGKNDLARPY